MPDPFAAERKIERHATQGRDVYGKTMPVQKSPVPSSYDSVAGYEKSSFKSDGLMQHAQGASASARVKPKTDHRTVVLLTTCDKDEPTSAFLIHSGASASRYCDSLKIEIKESPNMKSRSFHVTFETGFFNLSRRKEFSLSITTKQTNHQKWMTQVWKEVTFSLNDVKTPTFGEQLFWKSGKGIELEKNTKRKLVMLLQAEYWERKGYSAETRMTLLKEKGIAVAGNPNSFSTMFDRLDIVIEKHSF